VRTADRDAVGAGRRPRRRRSAAYECSRSVRCALASSRGCAAPRRERGASVTIHKVNLTEQFARFSDLWSPKVVRASHDFHVKLVKLRGEFVGTHTTSRTSCSSSSAARCGCSFRDREWSSGPASSSSFRTGRALAGVKWKCTCSCWSRRRRDNRHGRAASGRARQNGL